MKCPIFKKDFCLDTNCKYYENGVCTYEEKKKLAYKKLLEARLARMEAEKAYR